MKILVIALEGVAAELLFEDEQLTNFHRLMEFGCYGRLEGDSPATGLAEAWLSVASGRNPASLQDGTGPRPLTLWDQIVRQGKQVVIAGTVPFELAGGKGLIVHHLDGPALADLDAHTSEGLIEQVYPLSRKQFDAVRGLLSGEAWDFLQFFETGLGQIQRVFARSQSTDRLAPELDGVYHPAVRDYHRYLDGQVGDILETLADEAAIAVISIRHAVADRRGAEVTSPEPVPMGFFILAASNNPLNGEIEAVSLSDIAPTLLELAGYDIPTSMHGRSLVAGEVIDVSAEASLTSEEEEILRERLSGLGYIG